MTQFMQGSRTDAADPQLLRQALDEAFGYRGDVTLTLEDGSTVEGYVFDRRSAATLEASIVRIMPRDRDEKLSIPYSRLRSVEFTGKDTAAGKSWENWLKRYAEKKLKGEKAGIESEPLE